MRKKAIELIQSYLLNSNGLTLRQLSLLLCHDLDVSYRTARENYVLPLKEHKVLIPVNYLSISFVFNSECHISKSGKIVFDKFVAFANKDKGVAGDVGKKESCVTKTN
jgi:hypothetical protein